MPGGGSHDVERQRRGDVNNDFKSFSFPPGSSARKARHTRARAGVVPPAQEVLVFERIWRQRVGDGPLVAVAIHDGHAVRNEVAQLLALGEAERLREEDPHTAEWTSVAPTRVIGLRSRFEVDLNRPRDRAVYRQPDDAWGLGVWKRPPPEDLIARSLLEYDAFYDEMRELLLGIERRVGRFVVVDLHSYNHRRGGPDAAPAHKAENPDVNVGTRTMERDRWTPVVDRFIDDMRAFDFPGGRLDVRENTKFGGGQFPRWVHETFPETGCVLTIELKKFFMDEWTGEANRSVVRAIGRALGAAVTGAIEELMCLPPRAQQSSGP